MVGIKIVTSNFDIHVSYPGHFSGDQGNLVNQKVTALADKIYHTLSNDQKRGIKQINFNIGAGEKVDVIIIKSNPEAKVNYDTESIQSECHELAHFVHNLVVPDFSQGRKIIKKAEEIPLDEKGQLNQIKQITQQSIEELKALATEKESHEQQIGQIQKELAKMGVEKKAVDGQVGELTELEGKLKQLQIEIGKRKEIIKGFAEETSKEMAKIKEGMAGQASLEKERIGIEKEKSQFQEAISTEERTKRENESVVASNKKLQVEEEAALQKDKEGQAKSAKSLNQSQSVREEIARTLQDAKDAKTDVEKQLKEEKSAKEKYGEALKKEGEALKLLKEFLEAEKTNMEKSEKVLTKEQISQTKLEESIQTVQTEIQEAHQKLKQNTVLKPWKGFVNFIKNMAYIIPLGIPLIYRYFISQPREEEKQRHEIEKMQMKRVELLGQMDGYIRIALLTQKQGADVDKVGQLTDDIKASEDKIKQLKQNLQASTSNIELRTKEIDTEAARIKEFDQQARNKQEENAKLEKDLQDQSQKIGEHEKRIKDLVKSQSGAQGKIKASEAEARRLSGLAMEQGKKLTQLDVKRDEVQEGINKADQHIKELNASTIKENGELKKLDETTKTLQPEAFQLQQEKVKASALEKEIRNKGEQLKQFTKNAKMVSEKMAGYRSTYLDYLAEAGLGELFLQVSKDISPEFDDFTQFQEVIHHVDLLLEKAEMAPPIVEVLPYVDEAVPKDEEIIPPQPQVHEEEPELKEISKNQAAASSLTNFESSPFEPSQTIVEEVSIEEPSISMSLPEPSQTSIVEQVIPPKEPSISISSSTDAVVAKPAAELTPEAKKGEKLSMKLKRRRSAS